jgi:uncharacterized protein with HEPN domain
MKALPADLLRLERMLGAATEALALVEARSLEALVADRIGSLALERLLQYVADAAHGVSAHTRAHYADVPWARLARLRGTIDTEAAPADARILYSIVKHDAGLLIAALRNVLPGDED